MIQDIRDTIVSIASGLQKAPIGVIRLSGADSTNIIKRIFLSRNLRILNERTAIKGWIVEYDSGDKIDEVIIIYFRAPHSYTTEDMIEIYSHGNPFIMNEIVYNCIKAGARLAKEGEFTYRAFINGRIDLVQAEAINEIIQAESIFSVKGAIKKLRGELSKDITKIRSKLIDIIAEMEAEINFSETDEVDSVNNITDRINKLKKMNVKIIKNYEKNRIIWDNYKIAIVGKPNVGKSSLFNVLVGRERAIITEIAGTTRDYIEETIVVEKIPVTLIDTAGIRKGKGKIEQIGIEKSKNIVNNADRVIAMLDCSTKIDERDLYILRKWRKKICAVVINKIDLQNRIDMGRIENIISRKNMPIIETSIVNNIGIEQVKEELKGRISRMTRMKERDHAYILNLRQYDNIKKVVEEIEKAEKGFKEGISIEYIITHLYEAKKKVEELTGMGAAEEILDQIFAKFCIGK